MMAGKIRQAGKDLIPAWAFVCLAGVLAPCGAADAAPAGFAPTSYIGSLDPNVVWEALIGGVAFCAFLASVALWIHSALRRVKRSQARRSAFVSSALNNLSHGVVMTDPSERIVFCNDRYLDIYGLTRADISRRLTAADLLALQRERGGLDCTDQDFHTRAARPEGLITKLPNGRSILVKHVPLPNGGSIATHEDCSEQRELS